MSRNALKVHLSWAVAGVFFGAGITLGQTVVLKISEMRSK